MKCGSRGAAPDPDLEAAIAASLADQAPRQQLVGQQHGAYVAASLADQAPQQQLVGQQQHGACVAAAPCVAPAAATLAGSSSSSSNLSLILFDEVDVLADEDKGFMVALASLLADSKVWGGRQWGGLVVGLHLQGGAGQGRVEGLVSGAALASWCMCWGFSSLSRARVSPFFSRPWFPPPPHTHTHAPFPTSSNLMLPEPWNPETLKPWNPETLEP